MRAALWNIFWNRDFRQYAAITGQDLNPPANWPLAERMRVYIRKDIASQMLSLSLGPNMLDDLPAPVDAYLKIHRSVPATQLIDNAGFNSQRGLAIALDGSIYVADTGNKRVVVSNGDGTFLSEIGISGEGQLDEPVGIAIGPDGLVYVADTWNTRVVVFSIDGDYRNAWPVKGWAGDSLDNKP